jgi:hypothetical protein
MKTKLLSILITVFSSSILFAQQDHLFASTGQQKLSINPSLAGNIEGLNIQTLYAFNTKGLEPYNAAYTGVDYGGKKFSFGLSYNFFGLNNKVYNSNQIDLSSNYKIRLNGKLTLIPSLQVSYFERKLDLSKLSFEDYVSSNYRCFPQTYLPWGDGYIINKKRNIGVSSGLLLDINKKITFGIAVYDINQPDQGLLGVEKRALTQVYHLSGILFKDKKINLQPYSILKLQQNNTNYYEVGAYTSYKLISLRTAFRNEIKYNYKDISSISSRNIYLITGINISYKGFRLGYTLTDLFEANNCAHELFFSANLFNKDKPTQRNLMIN